MLVRYVGLVKALKEDEADVKPEPIKNRVTEMTGVDYPILQAPMGWIARAQLASAVSNSGAMGIIETSSGEFDAIKDEVRKMHELTDKPFGMNVALAFVKGTNVVDFVIEQGIKFVTTSSGSPDLCTKVFQEAGIKVFHVIPTLDMALKAWMQALMALWLKAVKAAVLKIRGRSQRWYCCRSSESAQMCRSLQPVVSAMGRPWRLRLRWVLRVCN